MTGNRLLVVLHIVALSACGGGVQSALEPRGPSAAAVTDLWWLLLGVAVIVQVAVTAAVVAAIWPRERPPASTLLARGEPTKQRVVVAAAAATLLVLAGLVGASVIADRAVARPPVGVAPVEIKVVAHQWWWEIEYLDADNPHGSFITANELHVPVGRPAVVTLESRDVVHSFWVPSLAGKTDVIPGRRNTLWFQADTPGVYRGQCAEFCGLQHAKMAMIVVAEPQQQFEAWAEASRATPAPPAGALAKRGAEVFLGAQCALCHRVKGTDAWGRVAPDLSRIGARRTLAAASLPNTRGHLAGWILDPQHVKPGTFMPATALASDDLQALIAYLESLR